MPRIKARLGRSKLQALAPLQLEHFYAELLALGGRTDKPLSPKSAAFLPLATTGMRRGEVLGLRWSDLDFDGE